MPLLAMRRLKRGIKRGNKGIDLILVGRRRGEIWSMGREVWLMPGGCPLRLPRAIEQGGREC